MMRKISLSVRDFALPCPRRGSIEAHSGYGAPPHNGQEIHQMIQQKRLQEVKAYIPEKKLSLNFDRKPYSFVVSGRADGFIASAPACIEEIKTAFEVESLQARLLADPDHPYVWQLKTYGYIHYQQTGEIPQLRLHLVSSRNFHAVDVPVELDLVEYHAWLERRLEELVVETKAKEKLFKKRIALAEKLQFPFATPRLGQSELIASLTEKLNTDEKHRHLLVQAPTGLGKTSGVLFPALKEALARGQKVIYVTPKNSQHAVAEEALRSLQKCGSDVHGLTLTAKAKMCLKTEPLCNPQYCEFAKDYYQKVHEQKLPEKLAKVKNLTASKLKKIAQEHQVCPFELSQEAIDRADVVIGDYNYVFAPRGLLGRLTQPLLKNSEKPSLVIDEAHNLPTRAQDYLSPSLSSASLEALRTALENLPTPTKSRALELLDRCLQLLASYRDGGPRRIQLDPLPFVHLETELRELTQNYLSEDLVLQPADPVMKLLNLWSEFVQALEFTGPAFFQTYQRGSFPNENLDQLKVTCCDASENLQEIYKNFHSVVAFSATLKPFLYYQELLGLNPQLEPLEFQSPFPRENRKLMIIPQISTKWQERSANAPKVAQVLEKVLHLKPGNYLALFPSFEFLKMVHRHLQVPGFQILQQEREFPSSQVQNYLEVLKSAATPTLLLAVQGGVFSEGVDYVGDMLIGAFVVGPALPTFDFEREQVRTYFETKHGKEKAFEYTYVNPAMAKAIQSAGRVIRSEDERGLIVLMDPRFLQDSYANAMPQGWFTETPRELVSKSILQDIETFWRKGTADETV